MNIGLPDIPLSREVVHYRDDHIIYIACDDTYAPEQYFSEVDLPRTEIVVLPTTQGDSYIAYALDRVLSMPREDDDELWLILDTDHCIRSNNVGHFSDELGRAEKAHVRVALSRPSFEYWLALYHAESRELKDVPNARKLEEKLGDLVAAFRGIQNGYEKTNVQSTDYPPSLLCVALKRAESNDIEIGGGRIPAGNSTRMYHLWRSLLCRLAEHQVPECYQEAYQWAVNR